MIALASSFSFVKVGRQFMLCAAKVNFFRLCSSVHAEHFLEIGLLEKTRKSAPYQSGQLFLHKIFAYRGIVVCPFKTKVYSRPKISEAGNFTAEIRPYYQVLIHRGDWSDMMLPVDQTSYLAEGTNQQDKIFSTVNGLDCVDHTEIIPYTLSESVPVTTIDHPMIEQFFELDHEENVDLPEYKLIFNIEQLGGQHLTPQCVYKETTDAVEVQIMTYYLGTTMRNGQINYCWRFVVRVQNLESHCPLVLIERNMKIYTLAGLRHVNTTEDKDSNKPLPFLGQNPAYQFADHIMLAQAKGGQLWGRLKMEKEDGSFFDCPVPTVLLDVPAEAGKEQIENTT